MDEAPVQGPMLPGEMAKMSKLFEDPDKLNLVHVCSDCAARDVVLADGGRHGARQRLLLTCAVLGGINCILTMRKLKSIHLWPVEHEAPDAAITGAGGLAERAGRRRGLPQPHRRADHEPPGEAGPGADPAWPHQQEGVTCVLSTVNTSYTQGSQRPLRHMNPDQQGCKTVWVILVRRAEISDLTPAEADGCPCAWNVWHMTAQVYMGYLRLDEAWQMVRHYFPGVVVTAAQVTAAHFPSPAHASSCAAAPRPRVSSGAHGCFCCDHKRHWPRLDPDLYPDALVGVDAVPDLNPCAGSSALRRRRPSTRLSWTESCRRRSSRCSPPTRTPLTSSWKPCRRSSEPVLAAAAGAYVALPNIQRPVIFTSQARTFSFDACC